MGAWGTAIFDNDTSFDLRGGFEDLVGNGEAVGEVLYLLEERLQRDEGADGFVPDERVDD